MYEPTNLPPTIGMPETEEKPTRLGIAALIVGVLSVLGICGMFGLSFMSVKAGAQMSDTLTNVAALLLFGSVGLSLLGIGLGIGGVVQKSQKKAMPIIGLVLSILTLIVLCGLLFLGAMALNSL